MIGRNRAWFFFAPTVPDPGGIRPRGGIRRAYAARGAVPGRKAALTRDPLDAMLATCTDGLIGIRDRALFCCQCGDVQPTRRGGCHRAHVVPEGPVFEEPRPQGRAVRTGALNSSQGVIQR